MMTSWLEFITKSSPEKGSPGNEENCTVYVGRS